MAKHGCKRAGSYRVCKFYDHGNEMDSIVARTDDQAYQFWFKTAGKARSWYKGIRSSRDVEDLLREAESQGIETQELK